MKHKIIKKLTIQKTLKKNNDKQKHAQIIRKQIYTENYILPIQKKSLNQIRLYLNNGKTSSIIIVKAFYENMQQIPTSP